MLSKETFKKILDSFAEQGKLFSNERQFQLELAWTLKEMGHEVYLEVLEDKDKKTYIDLIVKETEYEYVAIELKYTTMQSDRKRMDYHIGKKIIAVYSQGAGDVRRYDYLKDVQRIENLREKINVFGLANACVTRGYAIIMTNDNYSGKSGENTAYKQVALNQGRKIPIEKELTLQIKGYEIKTPIYLKGNYCCQWHSYNLSDAKITYETPKQGVKSVEYIKYPFEYMIMEIK